MLFRGSNFFFFLKFTLLKGKQDRTAKCKGHKNCDQLLVLKVEINFHNSQRKINYLVIQCANFIKNVDELLWKFKRI